MRDTTRKFDGYAKDYTVGRPGYAKEFIECLNNKYNISSGSVIADIGSGTGKFARQLLDKGCEVYCVEPNDDMRRIAEEELSSYRNFHSVNGDAEHTTLNENSVDHVTTAQAFHWFDLKKFRTECSRILKKDGKVFLIWNVRDESDALNLKLYEMYMRFCPEFHGFSGGIEKDDKRIREFFNDRYEYVSYDNPLFYDKEKFIARSLSGSYSLKEGDKDYERYIEQIISLFNKYSENGTVSIANKSVAYIGSVM